jgi:preprotein translocase subunit Sss1
MKQELKPFFKAFSCSKPYWENYMMLHVATLVPLLLLLGGTN